ncbi:MAG: division/cell wall cluster transcriptional repressor MraZ [Desulfovibrionaceae bacterium]|nr:division/cell wall cluster transcriptional repressor MraZ [Desulfovibrionaceae bacterium]
MQKLFTKSSQRSLDDKGRLMLPSDYRASLDAASQGRFWLTCLYGRLVAYLPEEWESFVEKLHGIETPSLALVHFSAKVIGLAEELACTAQGRVRIPQPLLREAGIAPGADGRCEVMVIGMFSRFEIWSLERFNAISVPDVSEELAARGIRLGM